MKKIISLILVFSMLFIGTFVYADEADTRFGVLKAFGIMEGDGMGNLNLERPVTRAEFTKMAIAASTLRNSVTSSLSVSPFPDVSYDKWYASYIYLGVSNGFLAGYKDGTFKPDNEVLYEEGVAIILRLLGYQDSEFAYSWPQGQISMGERIGLCDGVNSYQGQPLTRNQVSYLFYNLLSCTNKSGGEYTASLDHSIVSDIMINSSYLQDDTIKKGYVLTSAGTYEVLDSFDYSLVGYRGDAVVKDKKIVSFIPESTNKTVYNVFSVSGQNLVLSKDGKVSDYKLDGDEILYADGTKTTVSQMLSKFAPGDVLELHHDKDWELQYVAYSKNALEGPLVIKSSAWYQSAGVSPNAFVVRNGKISNLDNLEMYDVVYYSRELQSVWASDKRAFGIYEDALPNTDQIESIVLSGVTYKINSVDAFIKLSSGGQFKEGDNVTLLLDRDGNVCDVISPDQTENIIGFMISGGSKNYTQADGGTYSSNYVTLITEDGEEVEYESIRDYSNYYKNMPVSVSFKNGKATLSKLETAFSVFGKVSQSAKSIGSLMLDDDIKIVDIVKGDLSLDAIYKKVYLQRIDGVSISQSDIIYAGKNSKGKIDILFLNDVTGDAYSYGIITKAVNESRGMNVSGSYTYFDRSQKATVNTNRTTFSVYSGNPVKIRYSKNGVDSMIKLSEIGKVTQIENGTATIKGTSYFLDANISMYSKEGNEYQAITLDELKELLKSKTVTAYSESTNLLRGRIRVLLVK